jgi:AcrR family transcriptional regulator
MSDAPRKTAGRERLVKTARELFTSRGAANVGINEVTDVAGVARMTLYNNFPSKEALTVAVYEEMAGAALRMLDELAAGPGRTEEDRIVAIFDHFARSTRRPDYRGCPFIHASLQEAEPSGPIFGIVHDYKRALRQQIFDLLDAERGNRAGLADQLVLLLDGAVTEAYIRGVEDPLSAARNAARTLLAAAR